jgi:microcystin degradation protein MlrC
VGIVGIWQETNTYSSRPTTIADFEAFELLEGEAITARHGGTGTVIGGFLKGLGEVEAVPLLSAGAWPAAPPDQKTTAELLRRLERVLEAAPELDGLLVNLHGAMVAAGASDMEAEVLSRLRQHFPTLPIIAVLDLHANFSPEAAAHCNAVVGYRTYPHIDMGECGEEAAAFMLRALSGERFVIAYGKLGVLTTPLAQGTAVEPMRGLLTRAEDRVRALGAERVSLLPGFPYSDHIRCGFGVVAVASAENAEAALAVVEETLADVRRHLPDFHLTRPDARNAVQEAAARALHPVVLADVADNVGGGSPGDGTVLLAELVRQGVSGAVAIIADPGVVAAADKAGTGSEISVALGGKSDDLHGKPLMAVAKVARLTDGTYRTSGSWMTGQTFSMGPSAVLELEGGITVLVVSRATPPFHIEQLTANGIVPETASVIVAKGAIAWRAAYEPVMASAIEVDTPGCCPVDPGSLPRKNRPSEVPAVLLM